MAATMRSLLLYDLLAPEFLSGFTFPAYIDDYLKLLAVSNLTMTSDDSTTGYTGGVLYTGTVYFPSTSGSPAPVTQHNDPSGAIFQWSDVNFQFRLRTWREGSSDIQTVVNAVSGITSGSNSIQGLFNNFDPSSGAPISSPDYPGLRFRLELLVSILKFHMGSDWVPGIMDATYHVVKDTTTASTDVQILLPKITLRYEQAENFSQAPTFSLDSWGSSGFDAPSDLDSGQLVTMQPPLALHTSGRVAFSVQNILLDLSPNNTPYEILSMFGVGSDFTGIYIKAMQFYYADADKDFAFNISVEDALISFQGKVWLEAELDLMFDSASHPASGGLNVTPKFLADNQPLQANDSTQSDPPNNANVVYQGGSITAPPNVYIQLLATGGVSPYTYKVEFTSDQPGSSVVEMWDDTQNQAYFTPPPNAAPPPTSDESGNLVITVTDSTSGTPLKYTNTYSMNVAPVQGTMPNGAPQDSSQTGTLPLATFTADARPSGIPDSYQIDFTPSTSGTTETLVIVGCPNPAATVTITPSGGSAGFPQTLNVSASGQAIIPVNPGDSIAVSVKYPAQPAPSGTYKLLFNYDGPSSDASVTSYTAGTPSPDDPIFDGNTIPADIQGDGQPHTGGDALTYWVKTALDMTQAITITGQASYEGYNGTGPHNLTLSQRRANVAQSFVKAASSTISNVTATGDGQTQAQSSGSVSNPQDRVAVVTGSPVQGQQEFTLTGTLARAASATATTPATPPATTQPATPPAGSNSSKPPSLKRLSFRVRLEKNIPMMIEISGEIDFQQQTQSTLQGLPGSDPSGNLNIQNNPGATGNPNAKPSVVDFLLNVTYDTATSNLTETLTLGSGPAPSNGLLQMTNGPAPNFPPPPNLKNILGAVMIFAPIINAATTAIDPGSSGEWTAIDLAASIGIPVTIGALGWINSSLITLYGGTLTMRENVPSGLGSTKFTAAALTFDYGVSFWIDVTPLGVKSSRALSVRYKAFGFSLNFSGTPAFQFVFDTSKGYTLDLSDPSLFNLPGGLGDLLKIAGARIGQFNPLTIEIDLVIKQDLGVITVDEFLIKVPLDGSAPMILPSGIHVNLPGVLQGGGSVQIQDGGFQGGFDLTLVALSLRVAAQVGVEPVSDSTGRKATAFYLGIEVDFPTPIILGDTGLGIFGFFGMFAMHYMRNLPPTVAGSVYGPDLQWLIDASGQPQNLFNPSPPSGDLNPAPVANNWVPNIGSWAFGVGVLLGTVDGFLLTMRGMFILTLPGPQIIITVNLQIISDLDTGDGGIATDNLTIGILGILDLDFNLGQITIGVSIDLEVQDLISIVVPISIFFNWTDPDTWHVWLGTIQTPISANILGIVKGSGYFMIGGQAISPFPPNGTGSLPGVAVAVGFSASIIWGSESIDIYLAVVVGADLGVSFSPSLFISGQINLSGKLQLLIISIGASGNFQITLPNPFYLNVQVCGSVSFFFFSVSACCGFSIGSSSSPQPPPPLISRMYLQSYAPVIPTGQGGTRPIDASLGNAIETLTAPNGGSPPTIFPNPAPALDPSKLVTVPIDTVPVLQFEYAADASAITSTFTETVPQCPMLPTSIGTTSVSLGGGRTAVYALTSLSISATSVAGGNPVNPPLPPSGPAVPVVWRKNTPADNKTATRVDLALFSRDPNIASRALERSSTLNGQLTSIWSGLCNPIAPPACLLWTFCGQPIDYPQTTWNLTGIPVPDPPGTTRTSPVPTAMEVTAPVFANASALLAALGPLFGGNAFQPARVIGIKGDDAKTGCMRGLELPEFIQTNIATGRTKENVTLNDPGPVLTSPAAQARLIKLENSWRWVQLNVGPSTQVSLYMALDPSLAQFSFSSFGDTSGLINLNTAFDIDVDLSLVKAANQLTPVNPIIQAAGSGILANIQKSDVLIRERDASGTLLRESTLESLNPNLVIGTLGLPSTWTDPQGPWWEEISRISMYFDAGLQTLSKVFVQFTPLANTSIIEVAEVGPVLPNRPTVVIGAVQACSQAEQARNQLGLQVQNSQVATLEGYLDGGSPVPLLIPNTEYTITVEYNVTTTEADGTTQNSFNGTQQGFTFQTDSVPPPKLDPWVLSSLPANQEENVFFDDPVTIAFNDQEAIQLFAAYGEQLVLQLHAADGLNDPPQTVTVTAQVSGFGSAGYDSLLNLIQQGLAPCVGSASSYLNAQFTAHVNLRPLMAYTLDIVMDPAPPVASVPQGQQPVPVVPLYRTRFTTSKYASLADLATEIGTSRIQHAHLNGPLTQLPAPTGGKGTQVTDQAIESAFVAAGEQALPAAADNTITIYWVPGPNNGPYVPYCILIDCTEPLWRWRQEPKLVPIDPTDPSFNIVQITPSAALEVIESGGPSIAGYLYSPSGTRTIAFFTANFSPPSGGATVTMQLHRPSSAAFSLADTVATIIALQIGPNAPWEDDHV